MIRQMNRLKINLILAILMALMTVSSCEIFSDEETDKQCKENELGAVLPWIVSVDYQINRHDNQPNTTHNLMDAYQVDFIGTVRRMDCRDDETEYRDFVVSSYPVNYTSGLTSYTCKVDDFQFLFENKMEYVTILFYLKAYFNDTKIYESSDLSKATMRIKDWEAGADHYFLDFAGVLIWHDISK
jgi:hypothetical protein